MIQRLKITKDFFKCVFIEREKFIKMVDVKHIIVLNKPELSVKDIYEHYKYDNKLKLYLTDRLIMGR
jgi:hypothetical protein